MLAWAVIVPFVLAWSGARSMDNNLCPAGSQCMMAGFAFLQNRKSMKKLAVNSTFEEVESTGEGSLTTTVKDVKNIGTGCWGGCSGTAGNCAFCGTDGACCRQGWADKPRDPAECKGATGWTGGGHQCVKKANGAGNVANIGQDCWRGCSGTAGNCDFCGTDGVCCRQGWADEPPDPAECKGATGWTGGGHQCVEKANVAKNVANIGQDCWKSCSGKAGNCAFCGAKGACCRQGWADKPRDPAECKGATGWTGGGHQCVKKLNGAGNVANIGQDCWRGCSGTAGNCDFCDTDGVCCRQGWADEPPDPAECKGATGWTGGGHQCVEKATTPTPTEAPIVPTEAPTPPPTEAPTPPPAPNSITTDKRSYAYNEAIHITWRRDQPVANRREWIGAFATHEMTEEMIPTEQKAINRWVRYTEMWTRTCGSISCRTSTAEQATIEWGPEAAPGQLGRGDLREPWPLPQGCYKLALIANLGWPVGWKVVAVSEVFSVGPQDMTLCKPPSWDPIPGSVTHVATLGRGVGFSMRAHRFPVVGRPFEPLGGFKTHPDEGRLRIGKWLYGPGTLHGNNGHAKKLFATLRKDGTEGVLWKDYRSETIQATWLSDDLVSAETHTIYSTKAELAAVAFNGDDVLIMLLIFDVSNARFVKASCTTGETLAETETFALGTFGIKGFEKNSIASMVWNVEADIVAVFISGVFVGGHQGGDRSIISATTLQKIYGPHQTSSHVAGNSLILGSDGKFINMDLSDNFPQRGIVLLQFNEEMSSTFVPYTVKTHHGSRPNGKPVYEEISTAAKTFYKWSNDNNVYTELAHEGLVEVADGYLVFFSGEQPPLDMSLLGKTLNVARNAGFVKIGKDLSKKEVLSVGPTETGEYYDFGGGHRVQENRGINWITNFRDVHTSVSRMKTARLEDGKILVYWEVWSVDTYQYSQMMVVNDDGTPQAGPWVVGSRMALPYADDLLVRGGGRAVAYAGTCDTQCQHGGTCQQGDCFLLRYELCASADC